HAAESAFNLLSDMGVPEVIMLALLPFIVHFAVGGNAAMIAVSFPMLMPFFEADGVLLAGAVMLAFVSARAGGLASPANNGFIMLAEYSQTRMRRVYKYLLPAVAILMFLGVVFFIYI
ncbi:MAG: DUF401 family protein, partial [Chloroflexi bacterium]|nr:DUF401 family protein [Chloroflexota bacterium]